MTIEQIINAMVRRSRARRELLFRLVGRYAAGLERLWS